jgi:hypothetical protein
MRFPGNFLAAPCLLLLAACGSNNAPPQSSSSVPPSQTAEVSSQQSQQQQTTPAPQPTPVAVDDKQLAPLFGSWGLDPANCGNQVLKISKTRFEGPGSGCDISGYTDNGDGTFIAAVSCTAGGQTSTEKIQMRPIFAPSGEGIELVYLDRKSLKSEVLRCQGAAN